MPGDVELPPRLKGCLWLPLGHPARGAGPDGVEEVQGEVPPLGEVEADVSVDGLGEEQDQEGRCPEEDRHCGAVASSSDISAFGWKLYHIKVVQKIASFFRKKTCCWAKKDL